MVLCVLATDEEDEGDIALQIHFTLIQAFCCDNDIHILRVSGPRRLAAILGEPGPEPRDLHCLLVTVSHTGDTGTPRGHRREHRGDTARSREGTLPGAGRGHHREQEGTPRGHHQEQGRGMEEAQGTIWRRWCH